MRAHERRAERPRCVDANAYASSPREVLYVSGTTRTPHVRSATRSSGACGTSVFYLAILPACSASCVESRPIGTATRARLIVESRLAATWRPRGPSRHLHHRFPRTRSIASTTSWQEPCRICFTSLATRSSSRSGSSIRRQRANHHGRGLRRPRTGRLRRGRCARDVVRSPAACAVAADDGAADVECGPGHRDREVSLLHAIRPLEAADVVRGQYRNIAANRA